MKFALDSRVIMERKKINFAIKIYKTNRVRSLTLNHLYSLRKQLKLISHVVIPIPIPIRLQIIEPKFYQLNV